MERNIVNIIKLVNRWIRDFNKESGMRGEEELGYIEDPKTAKIVGEVKNSLKSGK